jgi:hypothetical protein
MNGRAACTLPAPAKPLSLDAPKPSMASLTLTGSLNTIAAPKFPD